MQTGKTPINDPIRKRGIDFTGTTHTTRQEFKNEADINIMLNRFGVAGAQQRSAEYGKDIDFNIDLQTALNAVQQAKLAYAALPPNLRDKYTSWQSLLNALNEGTLELSNETIVTPPTPEVPNVP